MNLSHRADPKVQSASGGSDRDADNVKGRRSMYDGILARTSVASNDSWNRERQTSLTPASAPVVLPRQRSSWTWKLSAVFMVVGIQILLYVDNGIDFGIAMQSLAGSYAASATTMDVGRPAAPHISNPAALARQPRTSRAVSAARGADAPIPGADMGSTPTVKIPPSAGDCFRPASGPKPVVTGCIVAPHAAGPAEVHAKPLTKASTNQPTAERAWMTGLGERDRNVALIGLLLIGVSDPRLRFGH